jgi:hypothetical protein
MRADAIHRAIDSVNIGYANSFVAAGKFFGFVKGGKFGLSGEPGEGWHIFH